VGGFKAVKPSKPELNRRFAEPDGGGVAGTVVAVVVVLVADIVVPPPDVVVPPEGVSAPLGAVVVVSSPEVHSPPDVDPPLAPVRVRLVVPVAVAPVVDLPDR
jgi:hypothetical protein